LQSVTGEEINSDAGAVEEEEEEDDDDDDDDDDDCGGKQIKYGECLLLLCSENISSYLLLKNL
jgi:hypothetical protein